MHKFMFIPVGGLANRMRAVSSAVTLAQKTNTIIDIVWFQDWALHAPFKTLFCPINIQNVIYAKLLLLIIFCTIGQENET